MPTLLSASQVVSSQPKFCGVVMGVTFIKALKIHCWLSGLQANSIPTRGAISSYISIRRETNIASRFKTAVISSYRDAEAAAREAMIRKTLYVISDIFAIQLRDRLAAAQVLIWNDLSSTG